MSTKLSSFSAVAALALAAAAPAYGETYNTYSTITQNFTTLHASVPGANQWYTLYCLDVEDLQAGDILVVMGESQIQQPTTTESIFVGAQLVRLNSCPSSESGFSYTGGGTPIGAANGIGISPQEYRALSPKGSTVTVTSGSTAMHYVLYNVKTMSDDLLDVDVPMNTGDLQVLKIRP